MRRFIIPLLLALLPAVASAAPAPSFYVCAHPDDCFLFMSPNLYDDIVDAKKTVIIYLTSGDAGFAFSKEDATAAYPYAREQASLESTRWMADVDKEKVSDEELTETVSVHGHAVERTSYANTVSYFLRLPDGNMYGTGFERYGNQSLMKLKSGEIASMSPIDGAAPYNNWQDLVGVLSDIITRETPGEKTITLHIADPDLKNNYNDHSDHTTGAGGVMEALNQKIGEGSDRCYVIYKHIDYSIVDRPRNLDGIGLQNKSGAFAVLTAAQRHLLDTHNWDKAHRIYLERNYFTTASLPEGCENAR